MWCIGALTEAYRGRMHALLDLYARPLSKTEPVICIDEKSLQLVAHSRDPLPMSARSAAKDGCEYVRNGTTNLFVAVEPKAGQRFVEVTAHRGKVDFAAFVQDLVNTTYAKARRVHLVLDKLNTHFKKSFDDVLGKRATLRSALSNGSSRARMQIANLAGTMFRNLRVDVLVLADRLVLGKPLPCRRQTVVVLPRSTAGCGTQQLCLEAVVVVQ
jgi:hypothetical protein